MKSGGVVQKERDNTMPSFLGARLQWAHVHVAEVRRKLRVLRRLSGADWGMLVGAAALTVVVRLGLAFYPLRRVTRTLRAVARRFRSRHAVDRAYRQRATWAASRVGTRLLPKRPCLTQALVAQFFLWRRGDAGTSLHLGVTKDDDGQLLAHAWLECEGRAIIGGTGSPQRYQRLPGVEQHLRDESPSSHGAGTARSDGSTSA